MVVRRKRGCHSGHPQAQFLATSLNIIQGCLRHPQAQPFSYPHPFIHRKITQNLKTSIKQNSNKTFVRSVSIRNQTTTISTISTLFLFCFFITSTVFQLFYGKNSSKKTIEPSKLAHNAKKTKSVKTEQSVAI